jgi:hypothetical protein
MSEVIRFQPAKAPRHSPPDDRGAQILFFTGVRYQRMSDDQRAPARQTLCVVQQQGDGSAGDRTRRR